MEGWGGWMIDAVLHLCTQQAVKVSPIKAPGNPLFPSSSAHREIIIIMENCKKKGLCLNPIYGTSYSVITALLAGLLKFDCIHLKNNHFPFNLNISIPPCPRPLRLFP